MINGSGLLNRKMFNFISTPEQMQQRLQRSPKVASSNCYESAAWIARRFASLDPPRKPLRLLDLICSLSIPDTLSNTAEVILAYSCALVMQSEKYRHAVL
jgi:hypothetical protein